jgi:hypothetical protein
VGRSLTGPLRDARRFPSTRWYPAPGATRTTLGFGFVHRSRAIFCRAVPNPKVTIRNFFIAVHLGEPRRVSEGGGCQNDALHSRGADWGVTLVGGAAGGLPQPKRDSPLLGTDRSTRNSGY